MAPECFKQSGGGVATRYYSGKAVDIWALGMTIFTLVFNELPFSVSEGTDPRIEIPNINFKPYFDIYEDEISETAPLLVKNLSVVPEEENDSPRTEVLKPAEVPEGDNKKKISEDL